MSRNYYCLVAGLKEYFPDSDTKGFDALSIIAEIKDGISKRDWKTVELLYSWYDIENIVNLRAGREHFSVLGNFSKEKLAEELVQPSRLPRYIAKVVESYNRTEEDGGEELRIANYELRITNLGLREADVDVSLAMERNLFAAYYRECARSRSRFMREWGEFDRTLRNISAAFAARRSGIPVAEVLVGGGDTVQALGKSSAADFGLRGEIDYIDRVMAAIADNSNLIDKEYRVDAIRWEKAAELTEQNYFDTDFLLGYLVKVNIIHRWASLDRERGKLMLRKLIDELTGGEILGEMRAD
jgi:hypothetical protein